MTDVEISGYTAEFFLQWEAFVDRASRAFSAETKPAKDEREREVTALLAVTSLLRTASGKDAAVNEVAARFQQMAEALQDQIDGIPHPLFRLGGIPKKGRPADSTGLWRLRAVVCLGLEYLDAAGLDDAVAFAAKKYKRQYSRLHRAGTELRPSLNGWRKNFASEQVANDVALKTYKRGRELLDNFKKQASEQDLRSAGENLLAQAAERASTIPKI